MKWPSEEQIRRVAASIGVRIESDRVMEVLEAQGSIDVRAAPGSGKTTLIAAKVATLLDMQSPPRGICILSHTNAARNEVKERLSRVPAGVGMLQDPHYLGTIQAFVDRFLAIPYLRSKGLRFERVDSNRFEALADHRLSRPGALKSYKYATQQSRRLAGIHRGLHYAGRSGELSSSKPMPKPTTPTFRELEQLKRELSSLGLYRFEDMFHFAHRYLDENDGAAQALQKRFPVVIIDEMQDTSSLQEELLDRMFPQEFVAVQRFGDENQTVYGDTSLASSTTFPKPGALSLGNSVRFGSFIASAISNIAPNREAVYGKSGDGQRAPHAILTFDQHSILNVIPAFSRLVNDYFGDRAGLVVKAVGFRRRYATTGHLPRSIGDYLSGFVDDEDSWLPPEDGFRVQLERARIAARRSTHMEGARLLIDAVTTYFAMSAQPGQAAAALRSIRARAESNRILGAVLLAVLRGSITELLYTRAIRVIDTLALDHIGTGSQRAREWARWIEIADDAEPGRSGRLDSNEFKDATLPVVSVETIHAVKGQTHSATLVLETYFDKVHDVARALPLIAKLEELDSELDDVRRASLRRLFVAMSRPTDLLCLAVHHDHVEQNVLEELAALGWTVIEVCPT